MLDANKRNKLETAIMMYKENKDSDKAVYSVFLALATEQIYLPVNDEGNLLSLTVSENMEVIPIFSQSAHLGDEGSVRVYPCYMTECLEMLLKAGKNMVINPFSEESIQFILPYEALEKMLIPVMEQQR